ncbi:putative phloem protein [Helianthus annuus]|uniref:Phloem protein n=1 Tax=Helianthus annuus TaxID=4232 RepID=A0A251T7E1_HELAN|nr:protein PHLOEM PROTEIN 2-LIKE A1 [Helianthus annuus]KAF5779269.1 putative phloem protein [Helianthus annuus]KAJ0490560.1 putative phloem protein [Helianthus annuus]KAJ0494807.1 putative phloem protein [Helianthus annuus]KAJ0506479.1 putative phloem protein [Helianthus annuus]KAJ0676157.1 putative phloem protein [Helianthus annuus]
MGSGFSQQADTQQQSEGSPTHHDTKTAGITRLPHDCHAILKDADTAINMSSMDPLYAGLFLSKKRKKYWVDKASHGNCFLVYARDLSITWGEDNRYWCWPCIKETSEEVVDGAEMIDVCWLEIHGKLEISKLTPGIKYEVVFVVMLKDPAYGWEVPVNVRLILPDGNKQQHKENLMEKPRSTWVEIPVGEFMVQPKKEGFVEFSLYEYEGGAWKRGLLIKGAAIRPKH